MALRLLVRFYRRFNRHDIFFAEHRFVRMVQVAVRSKGFPDPSTPRPYRGAPVDMVRRDLRAFLSNRRRPRILKGPSLQH